MMNSIGDWQQQFELYFLERRSLVISVVCIIIGIIIWPVGILPLWGRYSEVRTELRRLQTSVNQIDTRTNLLQGIDTTYREDFQRVEAALPLQKQPFAGLLAVSEIASESGVIMTRYDLNPGVVSTGSGEVDDQPQRAGQAQTFPIEVTVQGSMQQLQETFRLLETNLPLFEIEQYSIAPLSGRNGEETSNLVNSELTIRMYYAPIQASQFTRATAAPITPTQQSIMDRVRGYRLFESPSVLPAGGVRFNNQQFLSE